MAQQPNNEASKPSVDEPQPSSLAQKICDGMASYFKERGATYNAEFKTFCEDNDFDDDDAIRADLAQGDPSECMLIDFMGSINDFPFEDENLDDDSKPKEIVRLLTFYSVNSVTALKVEMPIVDKKMFQIDENDLLRTKKLLKEQCFTVFDKKMAQDGNFIYILAVGHKYGFDYIMHLIDAFNRARVAALPKHVDVRHWVPLHFTLLSSLKLQIPKIDTEDGAPKGYQTVVGDKVVRSAMESFFTRVSPKMMMRQMTTVPDSLEQTVTYINTAILFLANMLKSTTLHTLSLCPFQLDLCFAYKAPVASDEEVNSGDMDSGDDDDIDEEQKATDEFVDCVGDIEAKLRANGLRYVVMEIGNIYENRKVFANLRDEFRRKYNLKMENTREWLQGKRFVVMVDRRKYDPRAKKSKDTVWFYEPPKDCRDIPSNAVGEWYLNATRTCLLPPLDPTQYGAFGGNGAKTGNENQKKKLTEGNIGSKEACCGALMTLAFHARSTDEFKCYLCHNAQIIRFMPRDVKHLLPNFFDKQFPGNERFARGEKCDEYAQQMEGRLIDLKFEAFKSKNKAKGEKSEIAGR